MGGELGERIPRVERLTCENFKVKARGSLFHKQLLFSRFPLEIVSFTIFYQRFFSCTFVR